jgi:hypothetical protein
MSVLRRAHDHHRDLRARLLTTPSSHSANRDRQLMMSSTRLQRRKAARLRCWFFAGHSDARSETQLGPQLNRASSFKAGQSDRGDPLIQRNDVEQCAQSCRHTADESYTARKSPIAYAAPRTCPFPRFPPLQAFGRRPSCAWRGRWAGIRNPAQERKSTVSFDHLVGAGEER